MQHLSPPRLLGLGQTIGIIALSSPCEPATFHRGVKFIESLGYKIKVALDPCKHYGLDTHLFSSDSPKARARALEDLFLDRNVSTIISARGAYGSMEILPELDFALISQHPKRLVGFSDVTAILMSCYSKAAIPAVHGPSVCSAFSKATENPQARQSAQCLIDFLSGTCVNPFKDLEVDLIAGKASSASSPAKGPIIGGNLSMLASLVGTPWEPDYSGHLLFMEETGEKPYRIHRMLLQLKLAGRLAKLKGVILGNFKNCEHSNGAGPSFNEAIRDIFADANYPVVGMIPAGHSDWNLPVPLGAEGRIGQGRFDILPPA